MALINCSMEKRTVVVSSGTSDVTSLELEIIPDEGYVVAARDFATGANPDATKIQSITLSDTETTGGPQSDGSYTAANKVKVTVDFVDAYAFTESVTFDIDPSGSATAEHLIPVKLQGTFVVPASPDKVTFTASSVEDFASSASTTDFYAYDNPSDLVTIMVMTIAATTNDFINEDPTIAITNTGDSNAEEDYKITRVDTLDSSERLTQVVYTVKATMPKVDRSGDVITFTGAGADIPGLDKKIYGYKMNTANAGLEGISRRLEVFGDVNAQFRIKMERGTLSGSTFTINSTDGIYVFDNSQTTIANIFEASTSTTTYPSEIQSDGSYDPATDPLTLGDTGLFFRKIFIPEDAAETVYRFTIIPETGTTIDANAPGIDTTPDPDVITFDIIRKGYAFFTANYNDRTGSTSTIEYFDHLGDTKGSVEPRGRKNTIPSPPSDKYSYEIVVTDTVNDFHLPNEENTFTLSSINYTKTLNSGFITNPAIVAELRANSDGFNSAEIQTGDLYASHALAQAGTEPSLTVALTEIQREALTNKTSFSIASLSDDITIVGDSQFLKIKFFTTDETPVYKSQTIEILSDYNVVGGDDNQLNTTTTAAQAVDREKLYLTGSNVLIDQWGTDDITLAHDLDTFTFTSAQTGVTTLDLSFNIAEMVKKFANSLFKNAGYVQDAGHSVSIQTSTDGTSYSKTNITTSTTHVKFTVSGAFLNAQDGLPSGYNTSNYDLLFAPKLNDSTFDGATLTVEAQPTLTLTNASNVDRNLAIDDFSVIIDFGSILSGLSASQSYEFNATIIHRLNSTYESIGDVEDALGNTGASPGLARY